MSTDGGPVTPEPSTGPTSSAYLEELLTRGVAAVRRTVAFTLDPGEKLHIGAKVHRNDLVTQVDRDVEERIAGRLEVTGVPIYGEETHHIEDFETYCGRAWMLDPVDGILNYVTTHRDWAISLALVDDGVPTLAVFADPVAGRLCTAVHERGTWVRPLLARSTGTDGAAPRALEQLEDLSLSEGMLITHYQLTQDAGIDQTIEAPRDMRCYGTATLEMAEVATDGTVVYAQPWLQPWDVAAGALLHAETGAVLTQMDGTPFDVRRTGSFLMGTPTAHTEVLGHLRTAGA